MNEDNEVNRIKMRIKTHEVEFFLLYVIQCEEQSDFMVYKYLQYKNKSLAIDIDSVARVILSLTT